MIHTRPHPPPPPSLPNPAAVRDIANIDEGVWDFELFEGVDVDGHDLAFIPLPAENHPQEQSDAAAAVDLAALKRLCAQLAECAGFNSHGWVKTATLPRSPSQADLYLKVRRRTDPPTAGMFSGTFARLQGEMLHGLRVFIYPTQIGTDMRTPADYKYGAETLFPRLLASSPVRTHRPEEANLFFVPIRCAAYRYAVRDRDEGQAHAESTAAAIVADIRQRWPFWNASLGSDHFYLCAHDMGASVGRRAAPQLLDNAIALVNTADLADPYYRPHKDIALPPHVGDGCSTCLQGTGEGIGRSGQLRGKRDTAAAGLGAPERLGPNGAARASQRPQLAFFAGHMQRGRVRPQLWRLYGDLAADSRHPRLRLVDGALSANAYQQALLETTFCLMLRGHRAWSPRLMDAVWFGCIPVVVSDGYDLPLQGLAVDWRQMAVLVPEQEALAPGRLEARLRRLKAHSPEQLDRMQQRLWEARHALTWHEPAQPLDAFHAVLTQLWLRRRASPMPIPDPSISSPHL